MPHTRARKEELVAQYSDLLEKSSGFVIVKFAGLSVKETQQLRAKIREADGQYIVAKNTLITKALEQKGWPVPADLLNGPVGIAFGLENMPGVAKAVLEFAEDKLMEERISVYGGVMTGEVIDAKQVKAVSKLPSLDELRAQLAGLLVAPAQGIASVINAATGQVVNIINAYVQDRQGGDEGEAA